MGVAAAGAEWRPPPEALAKAGPADPWLGWGYQDFSGFCFFCKRYPYENWTSPDPYELGDDSQGRLVVAQVREDGVTLRRFTSVKRSAVAVSGIKAPRGWSVGGFHFGSDDAWYLLLMRANLKEQDGRAVLRIRRYDDRLRLLGEGSLSGGTAQTYRPGVSGSADMAVWRGRLFVHLPQEGYADVGGTHHQWSIVTETDTATMRTRFVTSPASHSFAQFVRATDDALVVGSHGDGSPRGVGVERMREVVVDGVPEWDSSSWTLFGARGGAGDNFTGTTLNGFELAGERALAAGVSVPHARAVKGQTGRSTKQRPNLYLAVTDLGTERTTFRWLTNKSPARTSAIVGQPRLVRLSADRLVLMANISTGSADRNTDYYRRRNKTAYWLLDGHGRTLAKRTWRGQYIPLAQPVLHEDQLVWVGQFRRLGDHAKGGPRLAALDLRNPAAPRQLTR